ncbi:MULTISPECIES: spore cortex-lytic enzyme [Paenibacillus]|uniref:Spore cortex-lytic enzyme n=1 Tax=Paenibacillus radicis (ex Xue et al. 2023) TaxID=2972489 RepID=A0ABT1YF30_9BACL|nr:spore cortex-lytic enzyme [Paenibacillus radicis (ex Xue et al. 2023)]MCR8631325.1 spore cortex-lytic enzyme [Paenibacillus radicis (ex Xue et al. 2023)]
MRKYWRITTFVIVFSLLGIGSIGIANEPARAAALLKPGSSNGDVWDLQFRLKLLGYYPQSMDGNFGYNTLTAVSKFQKNYGLTVDGYAGDKTWAALKKYTLNRAELDIMAKTIYSEARGESYEGQVAVGAVIMNRIQSGIFPNNIEDVVFQPGAFTAVADGQYWLTPNASAYLAAEDAVRGWDPTYGSLYYFNPDTATSKWIWSRPQTVQIGNHIFAK